MVGGIAVALHALRPGVRVIAVEPKGKGLGRCLALSQRVLDPEAANGALDTIADAIRTKCLGPTPWAAASQLLDPAVLSVDDDQIRAAMRVALLELKQVPKLGEPSANSANPRPCLDSTRVLAPPRSSSLRAH